MEQLLAPISDLGFPIVVSMYLLVRLEGKMDKLSYSIVKLVDMVERNIQK